MFTFPENTLFRFSFFGRGSFFASEEVCEVVSAETVVKLCEGRGQRHTLRRSSMRVSSVWVAITSALLLPGTEAGMTPEDACAGLAENDECFVQSPDT